MTTDRTEDPMSTTFTCVHGPTSTQLFVRLATLLNDFNPAHYDLEFAQSVGLPGVIAPGTLLQGWLLADVEAQIGGAAVGASPHRVREIDLRLRASFGPGDLVEITYERDGDRLTATALLAEGSRGTAGTPVATATIVLGDLLVER